ncbi:MAG: DUF58 domain-containing protein [Nanoarchaeota archaeon]|nr:DUF58 domain-containing protein [Nanoarchaeota archaeon]
MIETDFLKQLDKFSLVIKKRVTSSYLGQRRSIAGGRGILFRDHRMYAPGDDIRSIDWKVYARTDDLYIKNYEEERNATVHVIIDQSGSMNFGKNIKKFEYAAMLGVGFAYLATKENEKLQFSTFAESLQIFQPKRGMGHLMTMVDHLNKIKAHGHSRMKEAIMQYKKVIGSKAIVILISDFLIPQSEIDEVLYRIADNDVKVIQVLDPIEKALKFQGDFKLRDSESGTKQKVHISQRTRQQYMNQMEQHTLKIEKTCGKLGLQFFSLTSDTPVFDAFYQLLS